MNRINAIDLTMDSITIYHNPRCTKSRQTLRLIEQRGIRPNVIEYLDSPPTEQQLRTLLKQLGMPAKQLVRRKEHHALGLPETDEESELIRRMAEHPQIIQRPIVVSGERACLGRPPENVLKLFE